MEIPTWTIRHYLDYVTAGWFDVHDLPPDDINDYIPYIEDIRKAAVAHDDFNSLRLGFSFLLGNPEIDTAKLGRTRYPYSDAEIRAIIQLICNTLWPGDSEVEVQDINTVRLVDTTLAKWRAMRELRGGSQSTTD